MYSLIVLCDKWKNEDEPAFESKFHARLFSEE